LPTTIRFLAPLMVVALAAVTVHAAAQPNAYCAPPKTMPPSPPPQPPPPVCQCHNCQASPCYVDSGIYVNDSTDLSIPTNGFSLLVSRHYDSSFTVDGPLGIGWASSLTPHLYYATYLYATNIYQYEVDLIMPDGARYRFTANADGTFTPPFGRRDTLVRNADGTFSLTPQRTRSVYAFASDGSLATITDDFGNALTFTYDANGRVQTVADASGSGRSLTIVWNPQGRIADVSDSGTPARHVIYSYNNDGTFSGMRDPVTPSGQQSLTYTYTSGRYGPVLSRIDDRWGRTISRLTWLADGKLQSYTEGEFNDANPTASTGERYVYTYGQGQTTKTSSLGAIGHSYTINGLITDNAQYDLSTGNVLSSAGVTYQYDSRGNLIGKTKAGITWTYTYDSNYPNQISTITAKDAYGNILTNVASWSYEYNLPGTTAPGAVKRVKRYDRSHTTTQTMAEYSYDAKGHVVSAIDETFRSSTFEYDASGNRTRETIAGTTTTYSYDGLGRVTSVTDAAGHTTSFTYDGLNRVLTVRPPKPSSGSALDFVRTHSYDNLQDGIVYVNITDANGRVTKTGYDALGHVVRTLDSLGNTTQFMYQYNLLKSITDANGNVTSYTYDVNRNLSRTTFPNGTVEAISVAWDGTVQSITDRRGSTTSYTRDALGRIAAINLNGSPVVTYQYDGEMLSAATYGSGWPVPPGFTYRYDSFWRMATETRSGDYTITYLNLPNSPAVTSGYTVGPPPGQTGPTFTVSYNFDGTARINGVVVSSLGTFGIDYDGVGRYSRITYPNGQTREFTYDDQGRITVVRNRHPTAGDLAIFQYDYDYDWSTGTYSMLGQRTSVTTTGPATSNNTQYKYTYDGNYQLTGMVQGAIVRTWSYDAIGNRTYANVTPYTYYRNGTNPLNGQRLQNDGSGGGDFTYDANGNVTGRGGAVLYTWDFTSRLTSFAGTSYAYDHIGRRVSATTGGTTTKYITLDLNMIGERVGTARRDYVFAPGIDEPLARIENGTATYYLVDGLGSVVGLNDSAGENLGAVVYDPWGFASPLRGSVAPFGYIGREGNDGLWFLRARYYDPSIGRFLSEDPMPTLLKLSVAPSPLPTEGRLTYAYGENNPALLTDPEGLSACSVSSQIDCSSGCRARGQVYIDCLQLFDCQLFEVVMCFCRTQVQQRDCHKELAYCLRFAKNDKSKVQACIDAYTKCRQSQGFPF
jgi:RHS repeat-associated protein